MKTLRLLGELKANITKCLVDKSYHRFNIHSTNHSLANIPPTVNQVLQDLASTYLTSPPTVFCSVGSRLPSSPGRSYAPSVSFLCLLCRSLHCQLNIRILVQSLRNLPDHPKSLTLPLLPILYPLMLFYIPLSFNEIVNCELLSH